MIDGGIEPPDKWEHRPSRMNELFRSVYPLRQDEIRVSLVGHSEEQTSKYSLHIQVTENGDVTHKNDFVLGPFEQKTIAKRRLQLFLERVSEQEQLNTGDTRMYLLVQQIVLDLDETETFGLLDYLLRKLSV